MWLALLQTTPNDQSSVGCSVLFFTVVISVIALLVWKHKTNEREERERIYSLSPEQLAKENQKKAESKILVLYGPINTAMVCPHCQTKGKIRTKSIERKTGVSGGKATAAVLTGGVSILATGLSRKEDRTQAHCDECENTWTF